MYNEVINIQQYLDDNRELLLKGCEDDTDYPPSNIELVAWSIDYENSGLGPLCMTVTMDLDWEYHRREMGYTNGTGYVGGWQLEKYSLCEMKIVPERFIDASPIMRTVSDEALDLYMPFYENYRIYANGRELKQYGTKR